MSTLEGFKTKQVDHAAVPGAITKLNLDLSCDGVCENCEKFFECALPHRNDMFYRRRMAKARANMAGIKHKIISVGGKGGVGKSLIAANISMALAMRGRKVTVFDQVFDGPCIPMMLGVERKGLGLDESGFIIPCEGPLGIQVLSMGLILEEDQSITWFHDMKRGATEELTCHVRYGERDYLIIDVPAGTSSDTTNILQYCPDIEGATIVTVPSEVSQAVAYKAAILLQKAKVAILGVFENMGHFTCAECGETVDILQKGGGKKLADFLNVPFLGSIPFDPRVAESGDMGVPVVYKYPDSEAAQIIMSAADKIEERIWKG